MGWDDYLFLFQQDTSYKNHSSFVTRSLIRSIINELNGTVFRLLTVCEQKERDKASQLILQTLDTTAKSASKNEEVNKRLTDQVGKLSSYVYEI